MSAWSKAIGPGRLSMLKTPASAASSAAAGTPRAVAMKTVDDGVPARVARRVGIGVELPHQRHREGGLLGRLADSRRLERLAVIDEAAG